MCAGFSFFLLFQAGNTAQCAFTIYVVHSFCPPLDPPEGGGLNCEEWGPGSQFSVCRIYCDAGKKFSQPVPQFYTCGAEGFWRPNLNALGSVNSDPSTPLVIQLSIIMLSSRQIFLLNTVPSNYSRVSSSIE